MQNDFDEKKNLRGSSPRRESPEIIVHGPQGIRSIQQSVEETTPIEFAKAVNEGAVAP
jgi:hypothetical protein